MGVHFPLLLLLFILLHHRLIVITDAAQPTIEQQENLRQRLLKEHPDMFPTEEALNNYLATMNQLSAIQHRLNNLNQGGSATSIQADGDTNSSDSDFEQLSASTLAKRPDQLPYLFEGDIVLTNEQAQELLKDAKEQLAQAERCKASGQSATDCPTNVQVEGDGGGRRRKRTLTSTLTQRWTQFPIPYVIDARVNRTAILLGIQNWQRTTCLSFQEFSRLAAGSSGLQFVLGSGCFSTVGRINGRSQQVSIGQGCDNPFVVSHEIAHALGFYHEQSRWDRDSFVQIQTGNVLNGFLNQFLRLSQQSMTSFGVRYDLGSVMHYDAFGFSRGANLVSIRTLDRNYQETIGQRFQLSFNDVKKMNFAYCNATCRTRLPCLRSGYTDPRDCSRCRCPDGLTGQLCDRTESTGTNCGQLILRTTGQDQRLSQQGTGNCNFIISAPANSRIVISMDTIQFGGGASPCQQESYVEIRYQSDLGSAGARFCMASQRRAFISEGAEVLVLYRSASFRNSFALRYRTSTFQRRRRSWWAMGKEKRRALKRRRREGQRQNGGVDRKEALLID